MDRYREFSGMWYTKHRFRRFTDGWMIMPKSKGIVGRKTEQEELRDAFRSNKPEFVAVYGRRRVGKTFLVRTMFERDFVLHLTVVLNEACQVGI